MRKSLMSAPFGIYVAEGKIDLSSTLKELGIDDLTPLTEVEKTATVKDLLSARSGMYIEAAGEAPSTKAVRPARGSHAPGTFWYYIQASSLFVLAVLPLYDVQVSTLEQVTGAQGISNAHRVATTAGLRRSKERYPGRTCLSKTILANSASGCHRSSSGDR